MAKNINDMDPMEVERLLKNTQKMFRHKIKLARPFEGGSVQAVAVINDDPDLTDDKYVLEVTSLLTGVQTPDYARTMSVEDFADSYGYVGWSQTVRGEGV